MSNATLNRAVKNFSLPATGNKTLSLKELRGQNVVVYFYPKDSTPGCTLEGQDFQASLSKFKRQNTVVLGVSRDSLKSHDNFRTKQGFKFDLLSDEDETLCRYFDVIKMKNMYGKKVRGIERSTFLIDKDGKLRQEWRKVSVKEHVAEVLDAVKQLNKS